MIDASNPSERMLMARTRLSQDRAERIRLLKEDLNMRSARAMADIAEARDALVAEVRDAYDAEHPPLSDLAEAAGYSEGWARMNVHLTKRSPADS
jgi:hypothetical protein